MKAVPNKNFGTLKKKENSSEGNSEGSGFGKLVFGTVAGNGYNTNGMSFEEAYRIFKELGGTKNWKAKEIDKKSKEEQAKKDNPPAEKKESKREEHTKSIEKHLSGKGATSEQTQAIMKAIGKISDEAVSKLNAGFDNIGKFNLKGYSGYTRMDSIYINLESTRSLDKQRGYDCAFETLTHETGHAYDYRVGISKDLSVIESARKSRDELLNNLAKEGGLSNGIKNPDRIQRAEREAIWEGLKKVINGDLEEPQMPTRSQFGFVDDPYINFSSVANKTKEEYIKNQRNSWEYYYANEEKRSQLDEKYALRYDMTTTAYKEAKKKFEQAEQSGANKIALEKYLKADEIYKKEYREYNAQKSSRGIISDFLGCSTEGKFDVVNRGYSGHSAGYTKGKSTYGLKFGGAFYPTGASAQGEFWAEFYQSKLMGETETLELTKRLMPSIYNKMEEYYNKIGE